MWLSAALGAGCHFTEQQIARIVASSSLPAAGSGLISSVLEGSRLVLQSSSFSRGNNNPGLNEPMRDFAWRNI